MNKGILVIVLALLLVLTGCSSAQISASPTSEATIQVQASQAETSEAAPEPTLPQLPETENPTMVPSPTEVSPSPQPSNTPEPINPTSPPETGYIRSGNPIVVDHTSVDLFEQIPDEYLEAARNTKMMYSDRSVGANINEGLNCLTAPSWAGTMPHCRTDYIGSSWNFKNYKSGAPARITFTPDPVKYDRSNWIFEPRTGEWPKLTEDFITSLAPQYIDTTDVLSYQFTYLNVQEGSDISDPEKGFFADNPNRYDIYDLEAYMAQHPDKTFILWTTSLARGIGSDVSTEFNDQMRQYAREHNLVLFDVADIESHTDQGVPCFDNRDGVEYCSQQGQCENYPDDGKDILAICQDYTTEPDGGHLGSVSGGMIRIAKAFWVLMAQISGWEP